MEAASIAYEWARAFALFSLSGALATGILVFLWQVTHEK